MSLMESVTNIIRASHAQTDMPGVLIGNEIAIDEITATLFEVDPETTTRDEAVSINEIITWAKKNKSPYRDFIKKMSYKLGFKSPKEATRKLYEYVKIKKSISDANERLEALKR